MKKYHLNKVSGSKTKKILILEREIKQYMILKKTSINYLITHFMENQWIMPGIE